MNKATTLARQVERQLGRTVEGTSTGNGGINLRASGNQLYVSAANVGNTCPTCCAAVLSRGGHNGK